MNQSELMQQAITSNRVLIVQHKARIGELSAQQPDPRNRFAAGDEVAALQTAIRGLEMSMRGLEHRLPMQIELDRVYTNVQTNVAAKEQQRLADDAAAHLNAVQAAALQQFLQVPGTTEAGFMAAWPGISQTIAVKQAVAAGTAQSANQHHNSPLLQAAVDVLTSRYGALGVSQGGGNLADLELD